VRGLLTRLLFLVEHKRSYLRQHWWHRLAVVLFLASIISVLLVVWIGQNNREMEAYGGCATINLWTQDIGANGRQYSP